jgi:Holliday junction resolvase
MIESEKVLERKLCKEIRNLGGHAYKFVSPNQRGVPDRLCILPNGVAVFVELKTTGKKPTKLQVLCMKDLQNLGQDCVVIDSSNALKDLINDLKVIEGK